MLYRLGTEISSFKFFGWACPYSLLFIHSYRVRHMIPILLHDGYLCQAFQEYGNVERKSEHETSLHFPPYEIHRTTDSPGLLFVENGVGVTHRWSDINTDFYRLRWLFINLVSTIRGQTGENWRIAIQVDISIEEVYDKVLNRLEVWITLVCVKQDCYVIASDEYDRRCSLRATSSAQLMFCSWNAFCF